MLRAMHNARRHLLRSQFFEARKPSCVELCMATIKLQWWWRHASSTTESVYWNVCNSARRIIHQFYLAILRTQYKPCTCTSADFIRLQKIIYNYQQDKQGANYYLSCAQRTCANAEAPKEIIQATAEAGDACHAHIASHLWRNYVADAPQDPCQHT
jgi:hypothetical protein